MLLQIGAVQIGKQLREADGAVVDMGWMTFSDHLVGSHCQSGEDCDRQGGGAVSAFGKAILQLEECHFDRNFHRRGGAVYVSRLSSLAMKSCSFLANRVCLHLL